MSKPIVAFRANGGRAAGLGHIRRCLTLGNELQKRDIDICFIVNRDGPAEFVVRSGIPVIEVQEEDSPLSDTSAHLESLRARLVIVDCYGFQASDFGRLEVPCAAIVDSPPSRALPVFLLTNGAINADREHYPASNATLLLGPQYFLLREEFKNTSPRACLPKIRRVLVTMGGSDSLEVTPTIVGAINTVLKDAFIDVVVGPYFSESNRSELERISNEISHVTLHIDPPTLSHFMVNCDFAISAGGQTTYELAATGTPAIGIRVADNQIDNLEGLAAEGSLVLAGDARHSEFKKALIEMILHLEQNVPLRQRMSAAGRCIVDGNGASRVADHLFAPAS
jgi:UDP-2,4-diacetamido-2,4,6-trideoxy-beta-L-altropyranose hydrolase